MRGDYNNLASAVKMARGAGWNRGTLEQLDASALERVRMSNLNFIRQSGIRLVEANVVYAVATKA